MTSNSAVTRCLFFSSFFRDDKHLQQRIRIDLNYFLSIYQFHLLVGKVLRNDVYPAGRIYSKLAWLVWACDSSVSVVVCPIGCFTWSAPKSANIYSRKLYQAELPRDVLLQQSHYITLTQIWMVLGIIDRNEDDPEQTFKSQVLLLFLGRDTR